MQKEGSDSCTAARVFGPVPISWRMRLVDAIAIEPSWTLSSYGWEPCYSWKGESQSYAQQTLEAEDGDLKEAKVVGEEGKE